MGSSRWRGGGEVGLTVGFEEVVEDGYAGVLVYELARNRTGKAVEAAQFCMLLLESRRGAQLRRASLLWEAHYAF